ncbi:MAG: cysteine desulfurase [Bacteroidetes bacterium]|nr:cysteine desulfurase [Bacteroidota bacterium]MBU2586099.1 cysteine desulfurase [Bacteroidota bacterium]
MERDTNLAEVAKLNFDVENIRKDFPILNRSIKGKPLVYLDNAATTQKPKSVIERTSTYYLNENSNIHRGVHTLSQLATEYYENSRSIIKKFLNASSNEEIIFTRGTTESINLIANTFGRKFIKEGDEIIISHMEHHSNIVPWQILCEERGAILKVAPINEHGELLIDEFERLITSKTKLVSLIHASNTLGTINLIKKITEISHSHGIPVLVDGAQAVSHIPIDMQDLDCDFYAFSGHKVYGPTGIGVLFGKKNLLDELPPYQGGGDMIRSVTFEKTTYNDLPFKFEAGTPNIVGAIGLGEALSYVSKVGVETIALYEQELLNYATKVLSEINELKIIGTALEKTSIISFVLKDIHPHDVGTILDNEGIAVRTGHHCTQPLMKRFNIPATTRASFAFYNTKKEIDMLSEAIKKVIKVFS